MGQAFGAVQSLQAQAWSGSNHYSLVRLFFSVKKTEKGVNKLKRAQKTVFQPDFGCEQHPKAGQNTQQMC